MRFRFPSLHWIPAATDMSTGSSCSTARGRNSWRGRGRGFSENRPNDNFLVTGESHPRMGRDADFDFWQGERGKYDYRRRGEPRGSFSGGLRPHFQPRPQPITGNYHHWQCAPFLPPSHYGRGRGFCDNRPNDNFFVTGESHFRSVRDTNFNFQQGEQGGYAYSGRGGSSGPFPGFFPPPFRPRPPPRTDNYRHWQYASSLPLSHYERFIVVSFNILADYLAMDHRPRLYYHIPFHFLEWEWRKNKILLELGLWDPDIICLQEVDRFQDLEEELKLRGYNGVWKMRTGLPVDGCAIFWRGARFTLVHEEHIEFQKLGLRDNVAQICVLESRIQNHGENGYRASSASSPQPKGANQVVVCNIHVLFNPNRGEIKLGQVRMLLNQAHAVSRIWNNAPVIVCGDFNCTPKSPLYNFISEQKLDISDLARSQVSGQLTSRAYAPTSNSGVQSSADNVVGPCMAFGEEALRIKQNRNDKFMMSNALAKGTQEDVLEGNGAKFSQNPPAHFDPQKKTAKSYGGEFEFGVSLGNEGTQDSVPINKSICDNDTANVHCFEDTSNDQLHQLDTEAEIDQLNVKSEIVTCTSILTEDKILFCETAEIHEPELDITEDKSVHLFSCQSTLETKCLSKDVEEYASLSEKNADCSSKTDVSSCYSDDLEDKFIGEIANEAIRISEECASASGTHQEMPIRSVAVELPKLSLEQMGSMSCLDACESLGPSPSEGHPVEKDGSVNFENEGEAVSPSGGVVDDTFVSGGPGTADVEKNNYEAYQKTFSEQVDFEKDGEGVSLSAEMLDDSFIPVGPRTPDADKNNYDPYLWTPMEIEAASGNAECTVVEHHLKLKSAYTDVEEAPHFKYQEQTVPVRKNSPFSGNGFYGLQEVQSSHFESASTMVLAWYPKCSTLCQLEVIHDHVVEHLILESILQDFFGTKDFYREPLVTSYNRRFMGTVDYIWCTEGLQTVKVLDTLPKHVLQRTPGFPTPKWGSDHLALACQFAFTPDPEANDEHFSGSLINLQNRSLTGRNL